MTENNVIWHRTSVTRNLRETANGHKSVNLWFTGLSGSGKSTLAHAVEERLFSLGCKTYVFDGDNVRHGLCNDLGFTEDHRHENIRRIGEMVKLFLDAGIIALTAFISPFRIDRQQICALLGKEDFIEIYCRCSVEICEERDVKGIYKRARRGEIQHFTGISSPYEAPENPALLLDTDSKSLEDCVEIVIRYLQEQGLFGKGAPKMLPN
ncbi:MAG: adenylyl-sulfate kinase [Desulfurivibrionaceae bacterium]|jgi:adenylylsulfate kinase